MKKIFLVGVESQEDPDHYIILSAYRTRRRARKYLAFVREKYKGGEKLTYDKWIINGEIYKITQQRLR